MGRDFGLSVNNPRLSHTVRSDRGNLWKLLSHDWMGLRRRSCYSFTFSRPRFSSMNCFISSAIVSSLSHCSW